MSNLLDEQFSLGIAYNFSLDGISYLTLFDLLLERFRCFLLHRSNVGGRGATGEFLPRIFLYKKGRSARSFTLRESSREVENSIKRGYSLIHPVDISSKMYYR